MQKNPPAEGISPNSRRRRKQTRQDNYRRNRSATEGRGGLSKLSSSAGTTQYSARSLEGAPSHRLFRPVVLVVMVNFSSRLSRHALCPFTVSINQSTVRRWAESGANSASRVGIRSIKISEPGGRVHGQRGGAGLRTQVGDYNFTVIAIYRNICQATSKGYFGGPVSRARDPKRRFGVWTGSEIFGSNLLCLCQHYTPSQTVKSFSKQSRLQKFGGAAAACVYIFFRAIICSVSERNVVPFIDRTRTACGVPPGQAGGSRTSQV